MIKDSVARAFGVPKHLLDGDGTPEEKYHQAESFPDLNGSLDRPEGYYATSPLQLLRATQEYQRFMSVVNAHRLPAFQLQRPTLTITRPNPLLPAQ